MPDNLTLLISSPEIVAAVQRLAQEIDRDCSDRSPVIVTVLKGAFIFAADLVRAMQTPIQRMEFVRFSSYGSAKISSGEVAVHMGLEPGSVLNQDVIVIEDIIDTGTTTAKVLSDLQEHQPRSLKLCTLLDKPDRRKVAVSIDYLGFTVPDRFIVGYGTDFNQRYRQLPAIYTLDEP